MKTTDKKLGHFLCLALLFAGFNTMGCTNGRDTGITWQERASLPGPVANNAIAPVYHEGQWFIYSFMGLAKGKTYAGIHSKVFKYHVAEDSWKQISDVPGDSGRLAATAVTVNNKIYIFGGYTVAEDGSENSVPSVYRLDPATDSYSKITEMPVPVDDAVSVVYRDRYVYLISGWHDTDNVSNVQLYDVQSNTWKQATPYSGTPVFGHAGGIVDNQIVVADGVKVVPLPDEKRTFEMSKQSWIGIINPDSIAQIKWELLPDHPGPPRYRMAATGTGERVIFAGGSPNPYNYNGIGYNGKPSPPDSLLFAYNVADSTWQKLGVSSVPTMDHRSLAKAGDWHYIIGGMLKDQQVSDKVFRFKLTDH